MVTEVIRVDADAPTDEALARAVELLRRGGLLAYPTDTFYALGAVAKNPEAIARVFAAKQRSRESALTLIVHHEDALAGLVTAVPPLARHLMTAFWPGPLTILLPAARGVAHVADPTTGTVGVRVPAHAIARHLARLAGALVATSANRSGRSSPATAPEVLAQFGGVIEGVVDGGPTPGGAASTIVSLAGGGSVAIVRDGAVSRDAIARAVGAWADGRAQDQAGKSGGERGQ